MSASRPEIHEALRSLPSVDRVLERLSHLDSIPRKLIVREIRAVLAEQRTAISNQASENLPSPELTVEARLRALLEPSLRQVINATGIILHTNLGRAPLANFDPIKCYSNLEYDLETGKRGKRDAHTSTLLHHLLDRPAIVVNNNAAAVFLALSELSAGSEVLVSRGELIEIGDGFRIPEIMARSGAILREVGTTNRTRLDDYRAAVNERTRLILRVHPSNFRISGFTARPELSELTSLGRDLSIPVYEDLGSGCLVDLRQYGIQEPLVQDSFTDGANVVSFSCDKLPGGPQSGIIAGDRSLLERIRRNPLYRAFRVDKLILESLQATLRNLLLERWHQIPTLAMIMAGVDQLNARAHRLQQKLSTLDAQIVEEESPIGGGSTPDQTLPTRTVQFAVSDLPAFERRLRKGHPPVIARVAHSKLVLDMRTVADDEEEQLAAAVLAASM